MGNRVEFLRERLAESLAHFELCQQMYGHTPTKDQTEHLRELEVTIHQIEDTLVFVNEAHTSTPGQLAKALIDVVRVGSPRFEDDMLQKAVNNAAWVTLWGLDVIKPLRDAMRKALQRPQTSFGPPEQIEELVEHFVTTNPNPDWMLPRVDLEALAA